MELAPQELTLVFLNLFGNGFYATTKRQRDGGGSDFRPTLKVATRDLGETVEVRVRDNGTGIAPEIRDKATRRRHWARSLDRLRHRHPAAWRGDRSR
jgi:signal transduction histidine kinase